MNGNVSTVWIIHIYTLTVVTIPSGVVFVSYLHLEPQPGSSRRRLKLKKIFSARRPFLADGEVQPI